MVLRESKRIKTLPNLKNLTRQNEYFKWLCEIIQVNQPRTSYWFLAKDLMKKEFYWTVPYDDNRAEDGKKLRERFCEEFGYEDIGHLIGPCTMLEMTIALAMRIDTTMADLGNKDQTVKWFWLLMGNLGLDMYNDAEYFDLGGKEKVDFILNRVLERTYFKNGRGGLFPLVKPKRDQRLVEIWYQMNDYLLENYYTDEDEV